MPGDVPALIERALLVAGLLPQRLQREADEEAAAHALLAWAQPGDVVVLPLHTTAVRDRITAWLRGGAAARRRMSAAVTPFAKSSYRSAWRGSPKARQRGLVAEPSSNSFGPSQPLDVSKAASCRRVSSHAACCAWVGRPRSNSMAGEPARCTKSM